MRREVSKPRLLLLTSSLARWPGDYAGAFITEFAQALSDEFEITILAPASRNRPAHERWGSVQVYRFNYFWPRHAQLLDAAADLQPLLHTSWRARLLVVPLIIGFLIRALLLARRADIICSHWLVPGGLVGAVVRLLTGKPHVCVEHSGALHLLRKIVLGAGLARFITRYADQIVTVSAQLRSHLLALAPQTASKLAVIPMGVRAELFQQRESDNTREKPTILYLGRLERVKGVATLLEAVAGRADLRVIIAGEGSARAELEQYASRLQAPAEFIGAVMGERKRELLQTSDLVVIPSMVLPDGRSEGTPVVCLEAFAAARAVVASAAGGLKELIIDGETGLLCAPGDSAQLRAAILKLLGDDDLRARLGARAAQSATQYDWLTISARYRELFKFCVSVVKK